MSNKYAGTCHACGCTVGVNQGNLEYVGHYYKGRYQRNKYVLWCSDCYDKSDNSGMEDRCCGDRAYEDQCARACGYE